MPAPSKDADVREHAEFRGLRNSVDSAGFDLGDLEAALNFDVDDALFLHSRKGHSAVLVAGVDRSLWASGAICLGVGSNVLKQILPSLGTVTLHSGLTPLRPLTYAAIGDRAFYSNGVEMGVVQNGARRGWGLSPPGAPALAASGGALRPGTYQVTLTYLRNDGQESGAALSTQATLTETGGLSLTLPVSDDSSVVQKAIYVSDVDSEELFLYATVANSETVFAILESRTGAVMLSTQFLQPPPAGDHIAYANGRMLVAVGNRLYPSEAYAPELFDYRKAYAFDSRVTMVKPLEDGTWLGTDSQVAWLPNAEPEQWKFVPKARYGVIPGTAADGDGEVIGDGSAHTPAIFFATTNGLCAGMAGGQLVNFTRGRYAYPAMDRGAGIVRDHRGISQYLCSLQGTEVAASVAV